MMALGLSYYILFCHVCLLPLRSLFLSNEEQKGVDPEGKGSRKNLGRIDRGEQ